MATRSRSHLARYGPQVLVATFFVAVFPLLAVYALESSGAITSPIVATVVGVGLSVGMARLGSFLWMRHSGSRDLVFGDLMLWGWLRRIRTESKLSNSIKSLGLDRTGARVHEVEISPERQREILRGLATALETGDPFTHGHTRRVTRYSYMLAKTMRLPHETVRKIRAAAAVHDVGKIETPSDILNKPGALTDEEFEIMKRHSSVGAEMVEKLGDPEITALVRHHHERIDGKGYPDGLAGDDIPLGARVIAVADTFDAIISSRPYRGARRHKDAIEILERVAGTQLDERAVYAFLSYYSGRKPLAWWLSFSAGVQRVLGGMGGWLQHAQAASQGTMSLAAAVALTSASLSIPAIGDVRDRVRDDNSNRARVVAIEYTADESTSVSDSVGGYDIAPGPGLGSPRSRFAPAARAQEDVRLASLESDASDGLTSESNGADAPSETAVASTEPAPQEFDGEPEGDSPEVVDPAPPLPEVPGADAKDGGNDDRDPAPGDGCEKNRPGKPGKEVAKSTVPPGRGKDEDCDDDDDDDDDATDDDTNTDKTDTDDVTDTDDTNHDTTDSVGTGGPGDDTDDTGADNDSNGNSNDGNGNDNDGTADTADEVVPPEEDEPSAGDDGESAVPEVVEPEPEAPDVVEPDPDTPEVVEPEAPEDVEPEAPEVVEPEVPEVVIPETPEAKPPADEEAVD